MTHKNKHNRAFTLAELLVTLAVMGIVLALVTTFSVSASRATKQRTKSSGTLREIEKVNELITDWFYAFDDKDYTVLKVENKAPEYVYNYMDDTAIKVGSSEFTIQNKKFHSMIQGGIVPMNYQLVYNIDRHTYKKAITAVYGADNTKNKSVTLNYITNIDFAYDEALGILKCTYTYEDSENLNSYYTYNLVLSRHTGK